MRIDIDHLTEDELVDLNNRVVARLRFLSQMRSYSPSPPVLQHARMLEFKIGDRVAFDADGRGILVDMITRYNRKTVTVVTEDGGRWNVSPTLLRPLDDMRRPESRHPSVVPLRRT